jgi:hypothetical protein
VMWSKIRTSSIESFNVLIISPSSVWSMAGRRRQPFSSVGTLESIGGGRCGVRWG